MIREPSLILKQQLFKMQIFSMPDNKILRPIFQMNLISQKNLNQLLV